MLLNNVMSKTSNVGSFAIRPGDTVAILSPATEIKTYFIDGAIDELSHRGYKALEMPHARGPLHGTFASSDASRLADLKSAILNPEVKAILCSRGGYGCVHLLSSELQQMVKDNPKWLIGFSDVSALHALWLKAEAPSLHASMAKQLALYDIEAHNDVLRSELATEPLEGSDRADLRFCTDSMFSILENTCGELLYEASQWQGVVTPDEAGQFCGEAEGEITGGNLAVLNGLASTPWDILDARCLQGKILFLEDVGEKIYQVERMLRRLQLSGALDAAAGLVFGNFTDYRPDRNFLSMEDMIVSRLKEWGIRKPVALNFPIGHNHLNLPIPEGTTTRLTVTPDTATLKLLV